MTQSRRIGEYGRPNRGAEYWSTAIVTADSFKLQTTWQEVVLKLKSITAATGVVWYEHLIVWVITWRAGIDFFFLYWIFCDKTLEVYSYCTLYFTLDFNLYQGLLYHDRLRTTWKKLGRIYYTVVPKRCCVCQIWKKTRDKNSEGHSLRRTRKNKIMQCPTSNKFGLHIKNANVQAEFPDWFFALMMSSTFCRFWWR